MASLKFEKSYQTSQYFASDLKLTMVNKSYSVKFKLFYWVVISEHIFLVGENP